MWNFIFLNGLMMFIIHTYLVFEFYLSFTFLEIAYYFTLSFRVLWSKKSWEDLKIWGKTECQLLQGAYSFCQYRCLGSQWLLDMEFSLKWLWRNELEPDNQSKGGVQGRNMEMVSGEYKGGEVWCCGLWKVNWSV